MLVSSTFPSGTFVPDSKSIFLKTPAESFDDDEAEPAFRLRQWQGDRFHCESDIAPDNRQYWFPDLGVRCCSGVF